MKKKNFIFIITYVTVCYGELIVEQGSNHETSSLNHSQEKTNSILQGVFIILILLSAYIPTIVI